MPVTPQKEISVVIPTHNRAKLLRVCLDALSRQSLAPNRFEVIVVDDGSTDETREVCRSFKAPFAFRALHAQWAGPGAARNRGISAARGRYCLLLDDDILATPDLVSEHLSSQDRHAGAIGVGQLALSLDPRLDWFSRQHADAWLDRYRRLNEGSRTLSWRDGSSGNLSLPRAALIAAGGFATDLPRSCDSELVYRLERAGLKYVYVRGALGHQRYGKRIRDVLRDAEGAGSAAVTLQRRHPDMLPLLEIGGRGDLGEVAVRLRRALIRARVPVRMLGAIGPVLATPRRLLWYRFVFGCAYWRGVRRAAGKAEWRSLAHGVPILMYHALQGEGQAPSRDVMPVSRFRRQMMWLKLSGHHVLPLSELIALRREHRLPPPRSVVITFDDGYADFETLAHPVLAKHGFAATVFLVTAAVGARMAWDAHSECRDRPLLTWSQVQRLAAVGVEFGAHTETHRRLKSLPVEDLDREVRGSLRTLSEKLDPPLPVFAYPYGSHDEEARAAVERAGFFAACGVRPGVNRPSTPAYELSRISIRGTDSLLRFGFMLWLGTRRLGPPAVRTPAGLPRRAEKRSRA